MAQTEHNGNLEPCASLQNPSLYITHHLRPKDFALRCCRRLQLAIRSLDRLLTVLLLEIGNLATLPAKSSETLSQDGVRVVIASVHPVGIHSAKVLDLQLEQRGGELIGESKTLGKGICREK